MGNGKNKEEQMEVLILSLMFVIYIVAVLSNDREEYRRRYQR